MPDDLTPFAKSKKTFPSRPKWKRRDADWFNLVSPLDIDGVTVEGLQFRATALIKRPDESVTFQIEYHPARRRGAKGGPMARIEWRPLRGHNNKMIGPPEFRNILQSGSHYHGFDINWTHSQNAVRRGLLPISIPILPEPSFSEVLVFVGKEFNISPIEWIEPPEWGEVLSLGL